MAVEVYEEYARTREQADGRVKIFADTLDELNALASQYPAGSVGYAFDNGGTEYVLSPTGGFIPMNNSGSAGTSGSSGPLIVEITYDDGYAKADKTAKEIYDAFLAGSVLFHYVEEGNAGEALESMRKPGAVSLMDVNPDEEYDDGSYENYWTLTSAVHYSAGLYDFNLSDGTTISASNDDDYPAGNPFSPGIQL